MDNRLPPPEGFLTGDGFALQTRGVLSDLQLAEISPHRGLITVVIEEEMEGFPIEEYTHVPTIMRNTQLLDTLLLEYWNGHSGADLHPVTAWRPFVEAINRIYLESLENTAPKNSWNRKSLNDDYADWYANLTYEWYRQNPTTAKNKTQPDRNDPLFSRRNHTVIKQTKIFTNQLREFITEYKDQGLHHQDIDERWLRLDGDDFVIQTLVEFFLPNTVWITEMNSKGKVIYTDPWQCWRAIESTLDSWYKQVKRGESPFPIHNATPRSVFPFIEPFWALTTCTTMDLISRSMVWPPDHAYLLKTFPALFHNLNPHSVQYWFGSTRDIRFYPLLALSRDVPQFSIIEAVPGKEQLYEMVEVIWREYKQCHLYTDLPPWRLTAKGEYMLCPDHFTVMAHQILSFLSQVEKLWHEYKDNKSGVRCTHCWSILKLVPGNPLLMKMLEHRLFTELGFTLFLAAEQYPRWLEQEVIQTYQQHPLLPTLDNDAVDRQHSIHET